MKSIYGKMLGLSMFSRYGCGYPAIATTVGDSVAKQGMENSWEGVAHGCQKVA
jgi:hypothetical protein